MTRFLLILTVLTLAHAHAQTTKAYDLGSELDRYEAVLSHFEMARIKKIKMKVLTMERPGSLVVDRETGQIVFLWDDVDRNGALILDRTDILAIEDDPKYPGMYLHLQLANPAKFSNHLFEQKKNLPENYMKFNAKRFSESMFTEKLDATRKQIKEILFQLPPRGFDRESLPEAIKKVALGSSMADLRKRHPDGVFLEGQQGNALFHVCLVPERQEYLVAESLNGLIYRISRLLFAEKLKDVDRRYNEYCQAYQDKYGYQIDQSRPIFSLHNEDRVFRIASYGSRRPMVQEGKRFDVAFKADRKLRYSEPVTQIFYMFETDAPGSVEDLSSLVGLDDTRYLSYTAVELIDYGIWAKARRVTQRDVGNEAITSEDL